MKDCFNFLIYLLGFISLASCHETMKSDLKLWYNKPASQWEETLPLGNGRLGMTPDGGIGRETIVLNDITLWSGAPQDANNYEAYKKLPTIRQLLIEGKNDEAQQLVNKDFVCLGKGGESEPFGCFQTLGNLQINYFYMGKAVNEDQVKNYQRELNLNEALANCSYSYEGVNYKREYFTSFGDDVDVIKITSDKKGMVNCEININRTERAVVTSEGVVLRMEGELESGTVNPGMKYLAKVKAKTTDGKVTVGEKVIKVENATELVIFVSAATNFNNPSYKDQVQASLDAAFFRNYNDEQQEHIRNFQNISTV